jgi:hypothetical protein
MPGWKKPTPQPEGERMVTPSAPIDVLLVGARGATDWRAKVIPELDALGLVWYAPDGIPVASERLPEIGCTLVGLGDPGSGNHGLDTMFLLGQRLGGGYYGPSGTTVVFRFGELPAGDAFTQYDRDVYAAVQEVLGRSRVHVAADPAEAARACAVHRARRWDPDGEVEVETVTTTKRRRRAS